ncbi:MAG: DNA polymerase III subunit delta [Muricoprocola sp.]
MNQLIQDIKTNQIKNVYLLYGEETYLKRQYKKKLQDAVVSPEDTINLNCYEGKNISLKEVIDQAETMPFFSDKRLLVLENSGFFKNAVPEMAEYLEHMPETTVIIFVEEEVDKRNKLFKAVKNKGRVVNFERQKTDTLFRWILGILKREGKNITRSTMELFLEKTGDDMENISMELEKLLCYTMDREVITSEDVETICTTQTVNKVFAMIDAIADKQQKKALDLYYDLLTLKEAPMRILFLISRQFQILLLVKELREQGYNGSTLAEKASVPPFTVKNYVRQAGYFTMDQLRKGITLMVETEEAVKTGKLSDTLAVELIIVQMSKEKDHQMTD